MPLRDGDAVCSDCGALVIIRLLDLPQWDEELTVTVLCEACLERRVQAVKIHRNSSVERRGRPRKNTS